MQVLAYAGIPVSKTYEIIKNIAKKRVEKVLKYKDMFLDGMKQKLINEENRNPNEAEKIADMTWKIIEDSSHYSFNSCVSGKTILKRSGVKNNFIPTVEEMFKIRNDREYAKATGHFDLHKKYLLYGYGNALSMEDDHRIRKNKIIDIYYSGFRQVYKIETDSKNFIVCTSNHKFPTTEGIKTTEELKVGDCLYSSGVYEKTKNTHHFTNGIYESNLPTKGQRGFQTKENGAFAIFFREREKRLKNHVPCESCGISYDTSLNFELHPLS